MNLSGIYLKTLAVFSSDLSIEPIKQLAEGIEKNWDEDELKNKIKITESE